MQHAKPEILELNDSLNRPPLLVCITGSILSAERSKMRKGVGRLRHPYSRPRSLDPSFLPISRVVYRHLPHKFTHRGSENFDLAKHQAVLNIVWIEGHFRQLQEEGPSRQGERMRENLTGFIPLLMDDLIC